MTHAIRFFTFMYSVVLDVSLMYDMKCTLLGDELVFDVFYCAWIVDLQFVCSLSTRSLR